MPRFPPNTTEFCGSWPPLPKVMILGEPFQYMVVDISTLWPHLVLSCGVCPIGVECRILGPALKSTAFCNYLVAIHPDIVISGRITGRFKLRLQGLCLAADSML
jgi:hypothetical protein